MKVELLAPAGSLEAMRGAFCAGADAVYLGGPLFGARAYADNLTVEQLGDAIDEVHLNEKKLYLTVNTLLKEEEYQNQLYEYIRPLYERGLDAVILQDLGVLHFIREQFPDLPIHASTQMTVTGIHGIEFLENLGVSRVVTARELSLAELGKICKSTSMEIESFVHGALCYCFSGQCLYSSLIGGRSGNRGRCAQPCRLPYEVLENGKRISQKGEDFVLSPKDMCTLDIIPALVESGVYSFKIEGRMKKPEYVAGTVHIYRTYIDQYLEKGKKGYFVKETDKKLVMDLYNRGGFSQGYYKEWNGRDMISLSRPNHFGVEVGKVTGIKKGNLGITLSEPIHSGDVIEIPQKGNQKLEITVNKEISVNSLWKIPVKKESEFWMGSSVNRTRNQALLDEIRNTYLQENPKKKIKGNLKLSEGNPVILELIYRDIHISVSGEIPQKAQNRPATEDSIRKQILKTGNTPFEFEQLGVELAGDYFVPNQMLNQLRREGLIELEKALLSTYRRKAMPAISRDEGLTRQSEGLRWSVSVEKKEQLEAALACQSVTSIYLDCTMLDSLFGEGGELEQYAGWCQDKNKECYLILPHILRGMFADKLIAALPELEKSSLTGYVVRNLEEVEILKKSGSHKKCILDHNMYLFNSETERFWASLEFERGTFPLELNARELRQQGGWKKELIVYGYLSMMVSSQCLVNTTKGCKNQPQNLVLKDRKQKEFVVKNHCKYCYNTIYNTSPLVLLDQEPMIRKIGPERIRLSFTTESAQETKRVLQAFKEVFEGQKPAEWNQDFTRGHFKRGIE